MRMISKLGTRRMFLTLMTSLCGGGLLACKDLTGSGQLPAGTPNPSIYNSVSGAVGLRNAAIYGLGFAVQDYIVESGLLTDELQDKETGASAGTLLQNHSVLDPLDERILPEGNTINQDDAYGDLQQFRGTTSLAMHALAAYDTAPADTAQQHIWSAELHAYVGYVEILLADLYCSGVPLSTLDFQGDFTYQPGDSTRQLFRAALAEEDSALALGQASDSVINLARVLQGRAYLALGQYATANDDVTTVPTDFQYTVIMQNGNGSISQGNFINADGTIADRDGGTGLPYRSSGDPRSASTVVCVPNKFGLLYSPSYCLVDTLTYPTKYQALLSGGVVNFPVASGIEARLIQAEAAFNGVSTGAGDWLTQLNTLRTSDGNAGTGGVSGLAPLSDPGTPQGRIALLFQERAYWLFLTGHREGDLRRLLRQYSQYAAFASQAQVYPSGLYTAPGTGRYGNDVNVPVPPSETANPDFHGCYDRNP